jgi:hypothetical protein
VFEFIHSLHRQERAINNYLGAVEIIILLSFMVLVLPKNNKNKEKIIKIFELTYSIFKKL